MIKSTYNDVKHRTVEINRKIRTDNFICERIENEIVNHNQIRRNFTSFVNKQPFLYLSKP